jgi:hypothetical protein
MSESFIHHYFGNRRTFTYCLNEVRRLAADNQYYEKVLDFLEDLNHENAMYETLTYKQRNWLLQIAEDMKDEMYIAKNQQGLFS